MAEVMMTITWKGEAPSLASVAQLLQAPTSALSERFGVVLIDPNASKYTVLIDEAYANQVHGPDVEGPFSNPGIAHYGPGQ